MLITENENISVTRGDSGEISIMPLDEDGTPYMLSEGEEVRFYVCPLPGRRPVIEKALTFQEEDGSLTVRLSTKDTDIPRASYMYEAKLYSADGQEISTFIGGGKYKPRFDVT